MPIISTMTLDTVAGPMEVTIVGDAQKPAILTLPDIGLNHRTCFSKFGGRDSPAEDNIFAEFRFVHVDYPGAAFGAADLEAPRLSAHNLVLALEQVRAELNLASFVGLGVGFGAYCLASYALSQPPSVVEGLVLISWSPYGCGWFEWAREMRRWARDRYSGVSVPKEHLAARYFSPSTPKMLVDLYDDILGRMNAENVRLLCDCHAARPDISGMLQDVECDVFNVVGTKSALFDECMSVRGLFCIERCEIMEIPKASHLLTEECPKSLEGPIELFLNGLGYQKKKSL